MLHLFFKNTLQAFLLSSVTLLFACSAPTSIKVQPTLSVRQTDEALPSTLEWSLSSQDQRIAHYLIEIIKGDGAATLINESQSSRLIIQNALREQWIKQGLSFASDSTNKIDIQLIKLLAEIKQNSLTFENNAKIVINVQLQTENRIFSKIFTSHYREKGLLIADSKQINAQLNKQLSQLLNEIIQDPEVNARLQQR